MYVDDVTIAVLEKSRAEALETVNKKLELVCCWFTKHIDKLIVNPTKQSGSYISPRKTSYRNYISLKDTWSNVHFPEQALA